MPEKKPDTKQDELKVQESYSPSDRDLKYNAEIYQDFQTCVNVRNQSYPELDNMTPMKYVDESRMRSNGYLPQQEQQDQGAVGANVFFNKTRNKRNIIAAFVAAQRPRVEVSARGRNSTKTDKRIAILSKNSYDYYMDKENADEIYLDWTLESLETGTGFIYEYYDYQERIIKTVKKQDVETGELTFKEETRVVRDEPRSKIVPMECLYFPTLYETDLQNYPFVIYREYVLKSVAEEKYGKFKNWKYVKTSGYFADDGNTGEQFYWSMWRDRVEEPFVEILHRYKKFPDTHDVIINGVRMTEIGNPMLYDHKEYPFVPQYYEKIKGFIYGKSLPMKIVYAQDTFNELMNANINRSRSSSHVSFLTSQESEIDQDYVGTWEIIRTDDENALRELKVQSVQAGDVNMIQSISNEIDESTVDKSMNGSISGETATAIMNAVRQSTQNLGPQLIYIYTAAKKHAELRLKNIFQFFFNANLKGEAFEMKEINIEDVKLQDGQKGVRIIRVVDSKDKIPPKKDIEEELQKGVVPSIGPDGKMKDKVETNYDIVYITPDDIADLTAKIKIVPGSSLPDLKSLDKALLLEMIKTGATPALQQYPDFLELWRLVVEKFGYNPDDVTKEQDVMAAPADQQAQAQQSASNMAQGQPTEQETSGVSGASQLISQMTAGANAGASAGTKPSLKDLLGNGMQS